MPKKIDTNNKIRRAIVRIENGKPKIISADRKMSIKAVAEEAGVSDSLIHKDYPTLLERIKKNQGKEIRAEKKRKHDALNAEREKNQALRQENKELKYQVVELASINARLELELSTLRSIQKSNNISKFRDE
ncbi:TetR family transcriptional regulator [Zhongshania marina]|uniref:TetR family transcriptional regulator n=1 Tax=Zhongshania marina TaxID=2304603 RepID=A0A2S4HLA5_9GAMM|nr:TetR family transcriptional regulator [Marortus luteolus]POP54773.1 TetR family transcriptional regulator [Marortus luteolus]RNL66678.1 TetR family transcriptional regulator [Zhongshania marina]